MSILQNVNSANTTQSPKKGGKKWANTSITSSLKGPAGSQFHTNDYSQVVSPQVQSTRRSTTISENQKMSKIIKDEQRNAFVSIIDKIPSIKSKVKKLDPIAHSTFQSRGGSISGKRKSIPMS